MSFRRGPLIAASLTPILLIAAGCSREVVDHDERLAEATRHAIEQQAKQNEYIAGQAKSVVEQSREVAEAAKDLVAQDAEARRDMIKASQQLNSELHTERRSVDRQIEKLDEERKQIAEQRHRDPVIATAIEGLGLMLACLLPLAVCVLVLLQLRDGTDDEKAVGELLTMELMSDNPILLESPVLPPALPAAAVGRGLAGPPSDDSGDPPVEPPF